MSTIEQSSPLAAHMAAQVPQAGKKWGQMRAVERLAFCGKLVIALCTLGFVYPHVLND